MDYDVIIIGGGPGGLSAALYAARGGMKTLILEGTGVGGQMNLTSSIENYPGLLCTGSELAEKMRAQAVSFGAELSKEKAQEIKISANSKLVRTRRNEYHAKNIIIATGAGPRKLGVSGEDELLGAGVSYCATCDGAFFKDKAVCIVGGGNSAVEDAVYLSKICRTVTLIHRRDGFRAAAHALEKAKSTPNIFIRTNETVEKIQGEHTVKSLVLKHTLSSRISVLDTDAVFIAAGRTPNSEIVRDIISLDSAGYILTDENMRTSVPGIYAVGDVRKTPLRQVVTAAADGAVAANDICAMQ